jgi:putative NADPH-quinone reductase
MENVSLTIKNIAIINGSPRTQGNSSLLAATIKDAVERAFPGLTEVHIFSPATHTIAPCTGCEACVKTGKCVQRDDMELLTKALAAADLLIWINPLYFGTVTAQLKAIIDRFQVLWARNVLDGEKKGIPADRSRLARVYYISAKDDPFVARDKKQTALLPIKYASNTAGFSVVNKDCLALVGPSAPGDISDKRFRRQIKNIVHDIIEEIWDL